MREKSVITPDIKELVLARIDIMPQNFKLAIGDQGTFSKQELIDNIKEGSSVGIQVVQMELNFIKRLTTGKLMEAINRNE
jgi:hypothetical protein